MNSLALERQENNGLALPLDPEFLHTIRQLGRRPSLAAITDAIIRKYGTHFLLSATLGGRFQGPTSCPSYSGCTSLPVPATLDSTSLPKSP